MASTYTEEIAYIPTVAENGCIEVKQINKVLKDGVIISATNYRYVLTPGEDVTNEDSVIQSITKVVWTDSVIAAYKASC